MAPHEVDAEDILSGRSRRYGWAPVDDGDPTMRGTSQATSTAAARQPAPLRQTSAS